MNSHVVVVCRLVTTDSVRCYASLFFVVNVDTRGASDLYKEF